MKNNKVIHVNFKKRKQQRRLTNPFFIVAPFILVMYTLMLVGSVLIISMLKG